MLNVNPSQTRVAIIGAGFSGIAAAIALTRQGITDFVMFEESEGIGGTWWKNRYPGAEVDLESHIYSHTKEMTGLGFMHTGINYRNIWKE
jgi:cation diffusion facilitator CzcD-associated flavoprotein CzcO